MYLASKLTANAMSGLVHFAGYISAPMALRYGNSGPNISSSSPLGLNGSLSLSRDLTTIGVFDGYALSILNFPISFGCKQTDEQVFLKKNVQVANQEKIWFYPNLSYRIPSSNDYLP